MRLKTSIFAVAAIALVAVNAIAQDQAAWRRLDATLSTDEMENACDAVMRANVHPSTSAEAISSTCGCLARLHTAHAGVRDFTLRPPHMFERRDGAVVFNARTLSLNLGILRATGLDTSLSSWSQCAANLELPIGLVLETPFGATAPAWPEGVFTSYVQSQQDRTVCRDRPAFVGHTVCGQRGDFLIRSLVIGDRPTDTQARTEIRRGYRESIGFIGEVPRGQLLVCTYERGPPVVYYYGAFPFDPRSQEPFSPAVNELLGRVGAPRWHCPSIAPGPNGFEQPAPTYASELIATLNRRVSQARYATLRSPNGRAHLWTAAPFQPDRTGVVAFLDVDNRRSGYFFTYDRRALNEMSPYLPFAADYVFVDRNGMVLSVRLNFPAFFSGSFNAPDGVAHVLMMPAGSPFIRDLAPGARLR